MAIEPDGAEGAAKVACWSGRLLMNAERSSSCGYEKHGGVHAHLQRGPIGRGAARIAGRSRLLHNDRSDTITGRVNHVAITDVAEVVAVQEAVKSARIWSNGPWYSKRPRCRAGENTTRWAPGTWSAM